MAKKKKKNKKNKSVFGKVLVILLLVIVIGVAGFGYVKYNPLVQEKVAQLEEVEDYLLEEYFNDKVVTNDISFPNSIEKYQDIKVSFKSNKEDIISSTGKVNLPSYTEGDKVVEVTISYEINVSDPLFNIAWQILGSSDAKETKIKFTVKCKEPTALEKISIIESGIIVPLYTTTNIGLLEKDEIFNSVAITWKSSDVSVISNNGIVYKEGSAKLTATLKCEEESRVLEYNVTIGEKLPTLTALEVSFDDLKKSSYTSDYEKDGIKYVNAIIAEDENAEKDDDSLSESDKVVRLKATKDSSAYFVLTKDIASPVEISFTYGLTNSDKSKVNKDSFIKVYYSLDSGNEWVLLKEYKIISERCEFKESFRIDTKARFKVEFTTEYAELKLDIDDFKILREITIDDVKESLVNSFSTKFTQSRVLPLTTKYGGTITWSSSDSSSITKCGLVTRLDETKNVELKATILGFYLPIEVTFKVTVSGKESVTPVEVYFIDLGKYGLSDCGESIYIKYGSIDVLIDAGDDIKTSNQAIQYVIDSYSEDKVFEYLIATHPDSDHIGGMPFIFETYEIKNLIQFSGDHTSKLYQKYVDAYEAEECSSVCTALDSYNGVNGCKKIIELGNDVYIEILNTQNYEGKETNTRSVVCVLNAYGVRTLLTGDADNGSVSSLENDYKDTVGNIDILKAVHHGTRNGTTSAFLEAVDPEVVIICNGNYLGNKHGHPTPEAINRIYQYDSNITIYTITGGDSESCEETSSGSYKCEVEDGMVDRNGTIKLTIDESGYSISSEYYGENPLELSSTNYWKTNPLKEYSYQGK